jgi:DNA modification methylase
MQKKLEPRGDIDEVAVWCAFDEIVPIARLKPHPKTNNSHPPRQLELLSKIIVITGWREAIVVSTRSGCITKGHGRMEAATLAGLSAAPVEYQYYPDEAAELADLAADNRIAEMSVFNDLKTRELVLELYELDTDFELAGFELLEIEKLITIGSKGRTDPDQVPETDTTGPPKTNPGDIWIMGPHRLICAEAQNKSAADQLMEGIPAAMVFTDPPYNVDYTGATLKKLKIKNDNMTHIAFYEFIRDAMVNLRRHTVEGGGIYVCHADKEWRAFRSGMEAAGWVLKQCLIWEKNQFVLGRQDYHWRHEPILYGWNQGPKHNWYGGRKQDSVTNLPDGVLVEEQSDGQSIITIDIGLQRLVVKVPRYEVLFSGDDSLQTVWKVAKPQKNTDHPTIKPVELVERAIRNSSRPSDIVSDWFGGSGTTLIACETTGRKARLMELDPVYCDVIVRRWEEFTGKKATRV